MRRRTACAILTGDVLVTPVRFARTFLGHFQVNELLQDLPYLAIS